MSLRKAIFVSLIGVALSATTTSSTPTSVMAPTSSTSPSPPSTVTITVGESGLAFTPNTVSAAVGDFLVFSFYPRNHSVALGSWDKACAPAPNGFFSGFIPVAAEESGLATFRVTVHTSEPFVFYCTASRHCQDGMYGVVNPATTYNSSETSHHNLTTYATMARNASHDISPPAVMGGTLAFNGTTFNGTTDGTICGGNSANITSASTWCFPFIPDISSSAAAFERSLWVAVTVALAGCFL
ncbi:hypothetical protein SPBR_08582 [Sporothrix brasiliensis 5110]|uniref:Extracellular serine-rich protein n=1 Tax=Sporothrix brasiliensis 5110 TaxID=1398154 RepID=A0A0C2EKH2_9PEZI|nr:uncharacterized protein SPBR_08582 [Sporothrix brasiliensis 5110]KIH86584.1 hypothetical protein SPBR_08582 [Sporothrix brasiliensis 5110]